MNTIAVGSRHKLLKTCWLAAACALLALSAGAQSVAPRIQSEITSSAPTLLKNSLHPLAQAQFDAGRVPADTKLTGITIDFSRTAAQEADLKALIAAQQSPTSPLYRQWLTPDQFAARFGMADADLARVQSWLEQQGFSVDSVARSKNAIHFTGSVRQVEQAFSTEMHYYKVGGVQHFAPSTNLSVPAALAPAVLNVRNLDSFRPGSHVLLQKNVKRHFTQAGTSEVFFAPGDIATAYDIKPLYNSSITGSGQSITIVGQSAVQTADLEAFQNADGLTVKDPTMYLVPNTGDSTVQADGDEAESDLDLEWSNAIAPGATINFVYTGSNTNYSAFDSIQYAVDNQIGTIVSSSYGLCEVLLGTTNIDDLEAILEQGTNQGQTFVAAAGDAGSTDCNNFNGTGTLTTADTTIAVDYPASSQYVTGMGGTEIPQNNSAYLTPGDGYWGDATSSTQDAVNTLEKYVPEVVWNDDVFLENYGGGLSASGGGVSIHTALPSWQSNVPGIPSGTFRFVPDLALYGSPDFPGYVFCSSDPSAWQQDQEASCNSGFEDSNSDNVTAAGGTSFDAPIFSGMLALLAQKQGYGSTGQGLVNKTLYSLASDSATYASAFHDITTGNNDCTAGSTYCGSTTGGYSAGVGYDEVSGLGSVDLSNLAGVWPAGSGTTLTATTTTITASSSSVNTGVTDTFTITVTATSGTPTGTVDLSVDGGANIPVTLTSNGTYVYSTSFTTAGTHTILATYEATSTYASSSSSVSVTVTAVSSGTGTITLAATPSTLTVAQGSSGNETITVTPGSGYTGTVDVTFDTSNDSALENLCYEFTPDSNPSTGAGVVSITSATTAETTTLNLDANAADCSDEAAIKAHGMKPFKTLHSTGSLKTTAQNKGVNPLPMGVAFAGLLLVGFLGRGSRKLLGLAGLLLLATVGLAVSACGGVTNNNVITNPPTGSYTITVSAQDSAGVITATPVPFTFVIN